MSDDKANDIDELIKLDRTIDDLRCELHRAKELIANWAVKHSGDRCWCDACTAMANYLIERMQQESEAADE